MKISTKWLFSALLGAAVNLATAHAGELRVGIECTSFPFNYRDANGNYAGYDVDVANEIGQRLGDKVEFVCQKWDGMIPALLANKFDLVVASMGITEERQKKIDFSRPYRISVGRLVAPTGAKLALFKPDGTLDPEAFKSIKVGLQRSTTYDDWLKAKMPNANVMRYDTVEALFLDIKAGRVDTIMTNPMKAHDAFLSKPEGAGFGFVGPEISDDKLFGAGAGVGLRKGNEALLAKIDKAIAGMTDDGSLDRFSKKYFPFPIYPRDWKPATTN
ncbi:transporter substrate-binding domain-containing protein [Bosea sp. UC22_33]|uniref:transporter substrate-binding domain-containing protein n=1 Tax=Bosea sp. UC22_33 TaxID=3350165 RepID=UPI00366FFF0B